MKRDLLMTIKNQMPSFSKGQKLIACYVLEHYEKAAYMTASKLGALVGVSESTVVRFACELGFEGYPEFQKALQELIRNMLTAVQRIEVTNSLIGDGDMLEKVLLSDAEK
ncbi:MAG: MurR/RpiR family transcriptional regulator, partial [Clostridia bacterium]|nr:MurR/RpiR family transcriptional regulator [Clostridia bacterium]